MWLPGVTATAVTAATTATITNSRRRHNARKYLARAGEDPPEEATDLRAKTQTYVLPVLVDGAI